MAGAWEGTFFMGICWDLAQTTCVTPELVLTTWWQVWNITFCIFFSQTQNKLFLVWIAFTFEFYGILSTKSAFLAFFRCAHGSSRTSRQEERLLHSLVLRLELPVHGHGEAEQAAGIALPLHDIVQVQVKGGQPATSQQKDDEQRQSTGGPVHHGKNCWWENCCCCCLSVCLCLCVCAGGPTVGTFTPCRPSHGPPLAHTHHATTP